MIPVAEVTVTKYIDDQGTPRIAVNFEGQAPLHEILGMLETAKLEARDW